MHLMRIGPFGGEKPAARVDDDTYVDVSDVVAELDAAFLPEGPGWLREIVEERITAGRVERFAGQRIGAPIARPHQLLCIGLNYSNHAAETGQVVASGPATSITPTLPAMSSRGYWPATTSAMIIRPYKIVHYLSQFMVLEPGDLINAGTPPGVGMGLRPPAYRRPGDVMELGIDGLGVQRQVVVAAR